MIKEYYRRICSGQEVRQNLIDLRRELKEEKKRRAFAYHLAGDFRVLTGLLQAEDPKIRKNAALILGDMETEDVLPFLFAAYQKETTMFVKTDYLKAMEKSDYHRYLEKLKRRLEELDRSEVAEDNRKHVREESVQLRKMIMTYEKPGKHSFAGGDRLPDLLLVTNRCQVAATLQQITTGEVKAVHQGVRVRNGSLKEILGIRTWQEMLFLLPGAGPVPSDAQGAGEALAGLHLEQRMEELHTYGGTFYYRIEIKGTMDRDKKGRFIRKIAEVLDRRSEGRLLNHVSEYEVEIRLLERKDGTFLPMLKLFTIPDQRFDYRKETVASSISPVNAALTAHLAKAYLKEGAQILDPFCGVGTMLLERNKAVKASPMYGLDLFGEAVDKARENTARDGSLVNYINRNYFDFTHEYLFDEIITDMPRGKEAGEDRELSFLYMRFFEKSMTLLKDQAVVILYTMNPELVLDGLRRYREYRIQEEFLINEKNQTKVFVIKYTKRC